VSIQNCEWVCCHLGAREHYAVPRALLRRGRLAHLITDAWARPGTWSRRLNGGRFGKLSQRYHAELATAPVRALTTSLIAHEVLWRAQRRADWDVLIARNGWFQARAAAELASLPSERPAVVFAHSYSAGDVLRQAASRRWKTVLGQIDSGPCHYRLQAQLSAERAEYGPPPVAPPAHYFDSWRRECDAAHHIVVNSDWARDSVIDAGIDGSKVTIIPLSYEPETSTSRNARTYPEAFSIARPMRVLFVGAASVVKGAADLLDAFVALDDPRTELHLVGACVMSVPPRVARHPRIHWVGPVDRSTVMEYYQTSDVLVFPSHSDGFGMAQAEARAWALPVVASRHCGRVVEDAHTGIVLDVVSADTIAAALHHLVEDPSTLARFSRAMHDGPTFGIDALADKLLALDHVDER
jgi:hypothetical protein